MMRTFLMIAGPTWFLLASIFAASLLVCMLRRVPGFAGEAEVSKDLTGLDDESATGLFRAFQD